MVVIINTSRNVFCYSSSNLSDRKCVTEPNKYILCKCFTHRNEFYIKQLLIACGAIPIGLRSLVRDQEFLNNFSRDRNISSIKTCESEKTEYLEKFYTNCGHGCQSPCNEVRYKVFKKYEPCYENHSSRIRLFFYYEELKETTIEQVPRLDFPTLAANFGGQLGLMAGVSAISFVEILIWLILFLSDRLYFFYHKHIEKRI